MASEQATPLVSPISSFSRRLTRRAQEICSINNQGRKAIKDVDQVNLFLAMSDELDSSFKAFNELWDLLADAHEAAGEAFPSSEKQVVYDAAHRHYYEARMHLKQLTKAHDVSLQNRSSNLQTSGNWSHLPQISLPKFDGTLLKWTTFRDTFTSLVHDDSSLSEMTKMHYLSTSLHGQAKAVIQHLPLQASSYQLAWTMLQETYNNDRLLASTHISKLTGMKPTTEKLSVKRLEDHLILVTEASAALSQLKIPNSADFILYCLAAKGMDSKTIESFENSCSETYPTVQAYIKFLGGLLKNLKAAQVITGNLESITTEKPKVTTQRKNSPRPGFPKSAFFTKTSSSDKIKCPVCSGDHNPNKCKKLIETPQQDRASLLKDWQGCLNCLGALHKTNSCPSPFSCRFCHQRHHSLLHNEAITPSEHQSMTSSGSSKPSLGDLSHQSAVLAAESSRAKTILLGTALVTVHGPSGTSLKARVVVDCGSQHSFISLRLAKALRLSLNQCSYDITGIGQTQLKGVKGEILCSVSPARNPSLKLTTCAVVVDKITGDLPSSVIPTTTLNDLQRYELADPDFNIPGPVDFLVGADLFPRIISGHGVQPSSSGPYLLPTIFGHIAMGSTCIPLASTQGKALFSQTAEHNSLEDQLRKFWRLEEIDFPVQLLSPSEVAAEEFFRVSHYRTDSGRYVVRLPFLNAPPACFEDAERMALHRFYRLEGTLLKNKDKRFLYSQFMDQYQSLGHMFPTTNPSKYILPHHSVHKGDKIRVVFDASSGLPQNSLNDHLIVGPKLQRDIRHILLEFRLHQFVFTGDIVKMFRQILIAPEDRPYQHIFWRSNPCAPLLKYELATLTYGMSCSPFIAQRVLEQLANDKGHDFPRAAQVLKTSTYIDDIVTGCATLDEALTLKDDIVSLLARGGFELSKWSANDPRLLNETQDNLLQEPLLWTDSQDSHVKILGLEWSPTLDSFTYRLEVPHHSPTKRSILSITARMFDPLGFLAPVILKAKCFIQEVWKSKLGWDEPLKGNLTTDWTTFVLDLPNLSKLSIPRLVLPATAVSCQLIGFSDASMKGYSATIYLRVSTEDSVRVSLILAKTKVAPIKTISIPRLELCAALLLARAYASIKGFQESIPIKMTEPRFLTDSEIVLHWIHTDSHRLKVFVGNRASEIASLTPPSNWFHVRSSENPSDLSSRGLHPSEIIDRDLWWHGPDWLTKAEEEWPVSKPSSFGTPDIEVRALMTESYPPSEPNEIINWASRFSSYPKLLRSFSYVLRFISKGKSRPFRYFSGRELREAERKLIVLFQRRYLSDHAGHVQKSLAGLCPFVDPLGLLRVGGRLEHAASLSMDKRHPILLPTKSHLTNLIIDYYHGIHQHPGPSLLQSVIQTRFWVPSLRRIVRRRTFLCLKCYRSKADGKTFQPKMSSIPPSRLTALRPFSKTGVDYAGPFQMKTSTRRNASVQKAYLCVFVCFSTKAIHLEMVSSLTTEAFLATLSRFIARRGIPTDLFSDCGTNFVGANREIKELWNWVQNEDNQSAILNFTSQRGIDWHFNPPHAPHFGGLWEAAVKSAKTLARRTAGEVSLTFEEWTTLFTRIEGVLNSRPLCPMSSDPNESDYLTPGHFLIGDHLTAIPDPNLLEIPRNRLNRWQLVQKIYQDFWARWKRDYLCTLQNRVKWTRENPTPNQGDLVLIADKRTSPMKWPTARIQNLHPGPDGIVRVVTIRQGDSTFTRPVHGLVPLPLDDTIFNL